MPLAYVLLVVLLPGCKGKDLHKQLDRYLSEARWEWGFHGSALVAYDGQVILSSGYGMANRDFGELNTPQTKFFIGSVTKQFTAAAILLLHQQGRLQLDDPISRHLPQYPEPAGDLVTIRHLLTHTVGLPEYTVNPEIFLNRTAPVSSAALLESFWRRPLEFEPGGSISLQQLGVHRSRGDYRGSIGAVVRGIFTPLDIWAAGNAQQRLCAARGGAAGPGGRVHHR